jgi:hypothetical protein
MWKIRNGDQNFRTPLAVLLNGTPFFLPVLKASMRGLDALLVEGLAGQIADRLAPQRLARDRERRGEAEVRILFLLGELVVLQVVVAVALQIAVGRGAGRASGRSSR